MADEIYCDKLNVLIAHNYYQISGGEDSVVKNEANLLREKGHNVFIYSRSNSEIKNMSAIKKMALPIITVFNIRTFREVRKLLLEKQIDIVHVHNTLFFISPSIYYAAKSLGVPVVKTIHNFRLLCVGATFYRGGKICEECLKAGAFHAVKYRCYRKSVLQTFMCALNTTIHTRLRIYQNLNYICLTKFNKQKLLNLKNIDPDRIYVKPNFIKNDFLSETTGNKRKYYIFAGRIDELKGIKILLEAWSSLYKKRLYLPLYICGTGPLDSWCEDYIKEHNLSSVKMLGFIDNEKIKKIMAESKALILPTQWYEGFPVSIVEALSVGTPVIGANIGNTGSIIIENITGKKFDSKDPKALSEIIENLETNYIFDHEKIKEIYKRTYTDDVNYQMLIEIYQDIMRKSK